MLAYFINHNSLVESTTIHESFEQLRVNIIANEEKGNYVLKLFDELKTLSKRDSFELLIQLSGTTKTITDCSSVSYKVLDEHLKDYEIYDEYDLEIIVKKRVIESTVSIYFFEDFSDFLAEENYLSTLRNFDKFFTNSLYFEVFSTIREFGTQSIKFFQAGDNQEDRIGKAGLNRQEKIELLRQNTNNFELNTNLLPSDFFLHSHSENQKLNHFFDDSCSILSILFLSNSVVVNNDTLDYKLNGYKTLSCTDIEIKGFRLVKKSLYKIYDWTYEGGSNSDKLGLVRNLLSLHPDNNGNAKFDDEVWEAVQSNYQIYLKGNIQSYLEVKNKIGEIILASTAKTYEMVDDLLDSLKNNVLIIFTFILTVVVVNGLKDNGFRKIFSNEYTAIVLIISVLSAFWLYFYSREILKRFDNSTESTKKILNLNYNEILVESEIDKSINPVIEDNKSYLKKQIKRYAKGWVMMLLLFAGSYIFFNRYFISVDSSPDTISEEEISDDTKKGNINKGNEKRIVEQSKG